MNKELDIITLLQDCEKGTKLYSPAYGDVYYLELIDVKAISRRGIRCTYDQDAVDDVSRRHTTLLFNSNGTIWNTPNAECMLFPSKDQRDWSLFTPPVKVKQIKPCETYWYKITDDPKLNKVLLDALENLLPQTMYYYKPSESKFISGRIVYNNNNHIDIINDVDHTFSQILKMFGTELNVENH